MSKTLNRLLSHLNQLLPNKACTRLVGFVAIFEHFAQRGFEFFFCSQTLSTPALASNANR